MELGETENMQKRGIKMKRDRQRERLNDKKRDKNTEGARESQIEREELKSKREKTKERDLLHNIAKERF